jgi:hypothetical protein
MRNINIAHEKINLKHNYYFVHDSGLDIREPTAGEAMDADTIAGDDPLKQSMYYMRCCTGLDDEKIRELALSDFKMLRELVGKLVNGASETPSGETSSPCVPEAAAQ